MVKSLRQRNMQFTPTSQTININKTRKSHSPIKGTIVILLDKDNIAIGYGTITLNSPLNKPVSLTAINRISMADPDAKIANIFVYDSMIKQLRKLDDLEDRSNAIRKFAIRHFGHARMAEILVYDSAFAYADERGYKQTSTTPSPAGSPHIIPVFDPSRIFTIPAPQITSLDKIKSPNSHLLLFSSKKRIIGHAITNKKFPSEGILNIEDYAECKYFYEKYHSAYVKYVAPIDDHLFQIYMLNKNGNDVIPSYVEEFIKHNRQYIKGRAEMAKQLTAIFENATTNNRRKADVFSGFNTVQHTMHTEPVGLTLLEIVYRLGKIEGEKLTQAPIRKTRKRIPDIVGGLRRTIRK